MERAVLSTDEVVFEPKHLLELMAANSVSVENKLDLNLGAEGGQSIAALLEAALGDWVDFVFVPIPESIAIYADHDEYTTFYCKDESMLTDLASEVGLAGFEPISDYIRSRSGDKLR